MARHRLVFFDACLDWNLCSEKQFPGEREIAFPALRAGLHFQRLLSSGVSCTAFECEQRLHRAAEETVGQASERLQATSVVVHHELNVSRAEVQTARAKAIGVMPLAEQQYQETTQHIAQEVRAQARREIEQWSVPRTSG